VNIVLRVDSAKWQALAIVNERVVKNIMWLPTPIHERVPQLWFLTGLLFISAGLYIGFEYVLTVYYVGLGLLCCGYGLVIFVMRLRYRQSGRSSDVSADITK
jgi:hypothetical protein